MNAARSLPAGALDVTAVAALCAAGLAGFAPTFGGTRWALAAGAGLALGLLVAALGAWRRWPVIALAAIAVLGYLLVAGPVAVPGDTVAGVVPTSVSTREVLAAAVHAWKDVLTLTPPVGEHLGVLVVPLLTGLLTSLVAASLALRLARPWWALVPTAVALAVPIALGTVDAAWPVVQGVVFGVVTAGWAAWRRESRLLSTNLADSADSGGRRATARSRVVAGAAMVAVAGAAAFVLAPLSAAAMPRHTLRETVVPPLDLHQYHSPLVGFRSYVKDHDKDVLFTVDGYPAGARVRLATLDGYDGVVYDATDGGAGGSFEPVAGALPGVGSTTRVTVTSTTYSGVWLPDVGDLRSVTFSGPRAQALATSVYYDTSTGTAVTTAGLAPGDSYSLDVAVPATWTEQQLVGKAFASVTLPAVTNVPDAVQATAAQLAGTGGDPAATVHNLADGLASTGFFSHGLTGQAASLSGHTAQRVAALLSAKQMVGDDEQYAVAMALMARQLGIPARVVMGFYPSDPKASGTVSITGDDVHAWVEVDFAGAGWVAFDPTPAKDRTVDQQTSQPKPNPKPQVLQPPQEPQVPAELPPDVRQDKADDRQQHGAGWWWAALRIGGLSLIPVVLIVGPLIAVAVLKRRRRRYRATTGSPVSRVSGGWYEVVDRAVDLGTPVTAGSTRRETATLLDEHYPGTAVSTLAHRADSAVFGAGDPSPDEVELMWRQVHEVLGAMNGTVGRWTRLRARFSVRSLRMRRAMRARDTRRPLDGLRAALGRIGSRRGKRKR